ncbi:MAG: CoA transferase [Gammaproteobacteria bacterium]|nr:CoA transferase [Gammaproteobacteria bacterium]
MQTKPFEGLRVVDLSTRVSGAFAARLFGDFGADVILAEPPEGHPCRSEPPFSDSSERTESSVIHAFVNWNKRSFVVTSDVERNELISTAELVVTTSFDLDYIADIETALPDDAVHLCITAYGLHGSLQGRQGNNLTLSSHCGWASINGFRDEPPLAMPRNQNGIVGGVMGYIAAASALRCRDSQSGPERVDVSELEAYALTVHPWGVAGVYHGRSANRGPGGGRPRGSPGPLWNLADGRMNLGLADFHNWTAAMNVCGLPAQGRRPELISDIGRHSQDLRDVVHGLAESLPKLQRWPVFHALAELRCVIGVVQNIDDLVENEHLQDRDYFAETAIAGHKVRVSGAPAKLHPSPWRVHTPAPRLGEHSLDEVRRTKTESPQSEAARSYSEGPLSGIRVLSFGQAWSGTFATELLALLGADVVQIASIKHPDAFRRISNVVPAGVRDETRTQHVPNNQGHYNSVNLHKREIDLDLTHPKGQEILWQLIPKFDMLIDNFRPTVLPRWGVTLERLHAVKPGMIWASISGYGESGPYSHYPANGATTEPMAGLSSIHGYDGDSGMNTGGLYPDPISGYFLVATIMAALQHRDRTGEPQRVDLSMMEAVSSAIGDAVIEYDACGEIPSPGGNRHLAHAPHNMYKAAGDDWIAIAVETDEMWSALVRLVADDRLVDPVFRDEISRKAREADIDQVLNEWVCNKDAEHLATQLRDAGICASRVVPLIELYSKPDQALRDAGFIEKVHHPESGSNWMPGRPFRFSTLGTPPIRPAPCVGQHSQEVFDQELGMDAATYRSLVEEDLTGTLDERLAN